MPLIFLLVLLVVQPMLSGLVLQHLWSWFVVSTFHLPMLSLSTAVGLSLIFSYLTSASDPYIKKYTENDQYGKAIAHMMLVPLIVFAMGAVWHAIG